MFLYGKHMYNNLKIESRYAQTDADIPIEEHDIFTERSTRFRNLAVIGMSGQMRESELLCWLC